MKKLLFLYVIGMVLAACSASPQPTPAVPTVVLGSEGGPTQASSTGSIVASGSVEPAQQAGMVFTVGEKVQAVNVAEGDTVEAGQELIALQGRERLEAAVSTAEYELAQAEQAIRDLTVQAEDARIAAMQSIITYERALRDARYALDNFTVPSNQAGLSAVDALSQMKERLDAARQRYDQVKARPASDDLRQDRKEALDSAQADYNAAVRRLQYEYDLEVAEANLARAQRDYATYAEGPDPDQLRLAEARRATAEAQLAAAQAELDTLTLTAPFAGTVSALNIGAGEWATPGQPVLVLADLSRLRVETSDLSERDVTGVSVGQSVTVLIKALDLEVPGTVAHIAPIADTLGGDVVYRVTIDLAEQPAGLRAGMSVEVTFGE